MATREQAIEHVMESFHDGSFRADLARRIAMPTESQNPLRAGQLRRYFDAELQPAFEAIGFACDILTHDASPQPMLYAERLEDPKAPTVLGYGHGDVVWGMETEWQAPRHPWTLTEENDLWYGRGVADNKGQHSINLQALGSVLQTRGKLGFNAKFIFELGEEIGSPGLRAVCETHRERLAADVFLASDGPRANPARAALCLGSRGCLNFSLAIDAGRSACHSGNWGGLVANPAVQLSHALASLVSATGQIRVADWLPEPISQAVSQGLVHCQIDGGRQAPPIDPDWGEPGLTPAERVFAWNAFEVLVMEAGQPDAPVNAIPAQAVAYCQLRYVAGTASDVILLALRRHLDEQGFPFVTIQPDATLKFEASRTDPEHDWVRWAKASIQRTTGRPPDVLPNIGGSLPSDVFAEVLGLPTLWVPHSYLGCQQHAPDEHVPASIFEEGLKVMAGLYWDLGHNA